MVYGCPGTGPPLAPTGYRPPYWPGAGLTDNGGVCRPLRGKGSSLPDCLVSVPGAHCKAPGLETEFQLPIWLLQQCRIRTNTARKDANLAFVPSFLRHMCPSLETDFRGALSRAPYSRPCRIRANVARKVRRRRSCSRKLGVPVERSGGGGGVLPRENFWVSIFGSYFLLYLRYFTTHPGGPLRTLPYMYDIGRITYDIGRKHTIPAV